MGYIYTNTMSEEAMIQAYSDNALRGAIHSLRRATYLGKWEEYRLAKLEAELLRRKLNRRDSA